MVEGGAGGKAGRWAVGRLIWRTELSPIIPAVKAFYGSRWLSLMMMAVNRFESIVLAY